MLKPSTASMIAKPGKTTIHFSAGDASALSTAARRGLALFEGKAKCVTCHAGFNFTDESYHNVGVGMDREKPDLGRHTVTKREEHRVQDADARPQRRRAGGSRGVHGITHG